MPTFARGIPTDQRCLAPTSERTTTRPQPQEPKYASKLPGDPLALRGIPAIGIGVQGAITGTRP